MNKKYSNSELNGTIFESIVGLFFGDGILQPHLCVVNAFSISNLAESFFFALYVPLEMHLKRKFNILFSLIKEYFVQTKLFHLIFIIIIKKFFFFSFSLTFVCFLCVFFRVCVCSIATAIAIVSTCRWFGFCTVHACRVRFSLSLSFHFGCFSPLFNSEYMLLTIHSSSLRRKAIINRERVREREIEFSRKFNTTKYTANHSTGV